MLFECKKVSFGYENQQVIKDLSFQVQEGEYVCVVGENGSGKSTLIKGLLGLIPAGSGQVNYGKEISNHVIGYLPQQTGIQKDFPASVREIVLSGCQNHCGIRPFYNKEEKRLSEEMMDKLQITHFRNRCYRELSGGQQQRVLLARALCATKKILLLDEPVSGLDPKVTEEMYRLIEQLNHVDQITIIMISHDIREAVKYASHVMYLGEDIFYGTKQEYENR